MQTCAFVECPIVGVAEDEGFDVLAFEDEIEELGGIFQARPARSFSGRSELRRMMGEDDRRFVSMRIERFGKPSPLDFTQLPCHYIDFGERIEQKPIGIRRLYHGYVL